MAFQIILQTSDRGQIDILTKPDGYPADHYVTANEENVDRWVEQLKQDNPDHEVRDLRKPKYNLKRIAWELERTAMGDGFFGNALRVAKDIPGTSPEDRALLDRWADGSQKGLADQTDLCELAMRLHNSSAAQEGKG